MFEIASWTVEMSISRRRSGVKIRKTRHRPGYHLSPTRRPLQSLFRGMRIGPSFARCLVVSGLGVDVQLQSPVKHMDHSHWRNVVSALLSMCLSGITSSKLLLVRISHKSQVQHDLILRPERSSFQLYSTFIVLRKAKTLDASFTYRMQTPSSVCISR
jgi:hypothetical protein